MQHPPKYTLSPSDLENLCLSFQQRLSHSLDVHATVPEDASIMSMSWEANKDVNETAKVVYSALQYNAVEAFPVIVVFRPYTWGLDGDVASINSPNTHWEASNGIKALHALHEPLPSGHLDP